MFTFKEEDIRRAAMDGLRKSVEDSLRSSYHYGDRFKRLVEKAAHDAEPAMQAVIREGLIEAVRSPAFSQALQAQLVKTAADKFGGALQGVMIASAKKLADDPVVRDAMLKAAMTTVLPKA